MKEFQIKEVGGCCMKCAGCWEGQCFCSALIPTQSSALHAFEFISSPLFSESQPFPEAQLNTPPTQPTQSPKRRDHIDFKHYTAILKVIYQKLGGQKIDSTFYNRYYCRKDGFVAILNLIQANGDLEEARQLFRKTLERQEQNVALDLLPDPQTVKRLARDDYLRKSHLTAFDQFMKGNIKGSMKTIYNYDKMRQKSKFEEALKEILKQRKEFGLYVE